MQVCCIRNYGKGLAADCRTGQAAGQQCPSGGRRRDLPADLVHYRKQAKPKVGALVHCHCILRRANARHVKGLALPFLTAFGNAMHYWCIRVSESYL